jgi:hypothetical protein
LRKERSERTERPDGSRLRSRITPKGKAVKNCSKLIARAGRLPDKAPPKKGFRGEYQRLFDFSLQRTVAYRRIHSRLSGVLYA